MKPKDPKFDDLEEMRKDMDALSEIVGPEIPPGRPAADEERPRPKRRSRPGGPESGRSGAGGGAADRRR